MFGKKRKEKEPKKSKRKQRGVQPEAVSEEPEVIEDLSAVEIIDEPVEAVTEEAPKMEAEAAATEEPATNEPATEEATAEVTEASAEQAEDAEAEEETEKVFYYSELIEDEDEVVELDPLHEHVEPPVQVFEVDPITDDEDLNYKLPKFINMPNFVDYMLEAGISKKTKIYLALFLALAFKKYKDNKVEKMLIAQCIYKDLLSISQSK